ncbi:MBL fold metallo-hydrolase [Streptomyces tricolor]|nr:MBL fold metallo-hydrolase [Streptomyces tricolor]
MTVFEHAGKLLVVDCGVLFPEETQPGVDVILPDFTSIRDRLDDIVAVILTHGHEDHIGGVPYLLRERSDIPLVGSKLTLAFPGGQAQGTRHPAAHGAGAGGRPTWLRALRLRVRGGQPLHPRQPRGRDPHPGRDGAAHRRLQDGPVPSSTTASPICAPSPASARRGRRTCSSPTPPTPKYPASPPPSEAEPGDRAGDAHRAAPRHRLQLRQPMHRIQRVLDAAHQHWPQGRLRRPVDSPQHGHRP